MIRFFFRTLNDIARDCDGGDIQHKTCNTMVSQN